MYSVLYSTLNVQCTVQYTKCTMYCTVHCIITLFNIGNVLLCVIYQLFFTVFMYVTRISLYIYIYSVRYYPRFSVTAVGLEKYYPWVRRSTCTAIWDLGRVCSVVW